MDLSIVMFAWQLPAEWLPYSLSTLTRQTEQPREIIFVNACQDKKLSLEYDRICERYAGVTVIHAPQPELNLSKCLNIGIRAAQGQYVMTTQVEQLFHPTLIETISRVMTPELCIEAQRGNLKEGVLPDADNIDWDGLKTQIFPEVIDSVSPGTIICLERAWLHYAHGYDEVHNPYNYNDSDLLFRAMRDGKRGGIITFDICPIYHLWHPRDPKYNALESRYPPLDAPIVANDDSWGMP